MKKVIVSILALVFLFASFYALNFLNENDINGTINIQLIDELGDSVFNEEFDFNKEDTLFSILSKNHIVGCADSSFNISNNCSSNIFTSRVIMKIDTVETDWINSYFAIYVNESYSNTGIDSIKLNDGDIISFEYKFVGGDD